LAAELVASKVETPCLILDLDALERNMRKMGDYAKDLNMRHRARGKMHKSVDVLRLQQELGGAVGVCCQFLCLGGAHEAAGIHQSFWKRRFFLAAGRA
jgi:D-serine deaminase-like pyridoxal phosphate-dependent protein